MTPAALLLLALLPATAAPRTIAGPVAAELVSIYDGDTLTVRAKVPSPRRWAGCS